MKKSKKLESTPVVHDWWLGLGVTESWAYVPNVFSRDEINEIHRLAKKYSLNTGSVGSGQDTKIDNNIRDSGICFFNSADPECRWVFQRIAGSVTEINQQFWNFDLNRIETLQYTVYKEGQFYKDHIDMMFEGPNRAVRKLSFTIQLTDENEYEGGDLMFKTGPDPQAGKRTKGTAMYFPSYVLHEVTPVTKGTRISLVGWITGPAFK